ncbi:MAG: hypothetical protein DA408_15110 [Bacteroidetes bacterium]|nr:MAG: hypothetical protein C7N36_22005 [Bacteroidota bacterium]PTM10793.1 MAG: hypothetical protein DA408_15110 [Bacteroidota bacterium]
MQNIPRYLLFRLEIIWWLITLVITSVILIPILYQLPDYQFFWPNLAFVLVFITVTRYIFLLRYSFLANWSYVKVALIFVCFLTIFLLVQEINFFQTFLDENGMEPIVATLPKDKQLNMMNYIRSEMLLFGVGSVIGCVVLPLRLVLSIWRRINGHED